MSTDTMANVLVGSLLVVCIVIFAIILISEKECEESGGKYVRGLFGFECVVVK